MAAIGLSGKRRWCHIELILIRMFIFGLEYLDIPGIWIGSNNVDKYVDCRFWGQQSSNFNTSKVKNMPSQALSGWWCFGKGAASKWPILTGRIYWDGQYMGLPKLQTSKSENMILKYWISLAYIIYSDLMGYYSSDLMAFYSDLMGYSWDIPSGELT